MQALTLFTYFCSNKCCAKWKSTYKLKDWLIVKTGCITWRISKLQTYELMRQHYMISTRQDGQDLLQMQLWMQRMLIKPSSWGYYCSGNDSVLNLFDYTHSHVPHDNNRTHYS
jgi:hypothetical protein